MNYIRIKDLKKDFNCYVELKIILCLHSATYFIWSTNYISFLFYISWYTYI